MSKDDNGNNKNKLKLQLMKENNYDCEYYFKEQVICAHKNFVRTHM